MDNRLLTTDETAKLLRVHQNTLRRWSDQGYGPQRFFIGCHVRYRAEDVEAFIAAKYKENSYA